MLNHANTGIRNGGVATAICRPQRGLRKVFYYKFIVAAAREREICRSG